MRRDSAASKAFWIFVIAFLLAATGAAAVTALLLNIHAKQLEARQYPMMLFKVEDSNPDPDLWGKNFPQQLASYNEMKDNNQPTRFGGSLPYSKLIRFPQLTRLWAGYPFALDFNEERSHYYSQVDQLETKRNDREYLNAHGLPAFKGQPGACMNCHSGWAPQLIRELGWEKFNASPYMELVAGLREAHGDSIHGARLGGTCADCHSPDDMSLRVTRPAYINAMEKRGYQRDDKQGLVATRREMRSHVCQQCHVEYYFAGPSKVLTYPWTNWPKDEPLTIQMIDAFYESARQGDNGFKADWIHAETGAPMIKIQHPEAELYSSGIHARAGVACADCHMPYRREGAIKVTSHNISSPMFSINGSCQTCHAFPEEEMKSRVNQIQGHTMRALHAAEEAILALIDDIKQARALIIASPEYKGLPSPQEQEAYLNTALAPAREQHRKASLRWDFISSENSSGFHSPQMAALIIGEAREHARRGQLELLASLSNLRLKLQPTSGAGFMPPAPAVIPGRSPVGDPPPSWMKAFDQP